MDEPYSIGPGFWAVFAALVSICLAIDLFAHREHHRESAKRALLWSGVWIGVALLFGAWVTFRLGSHAGEQYFSAYLLEKSLSVDNLFVFLIIFERLRIGERQQRRVLFWGVLGALALRGLCIAVGATLIQRWHPIVYFLGALLIFTGVKLALEKKELATKEPKALKWLRKYVSSTPSENDHFFVRENGKWIGTTAFVALIAIELSDVAFAVDSIPAVFAVTDSPFIVYTSNVFAVLGLRALYIALARVLLHASYLRYGLAVVLVFAGAKMLFSSVFHVPPIVSLCVIAVSIGSSLAVGAIVARRANRRREVAS